MRPISEEKERAGRSLGGLAKYNDDENMKRKPTTWDWLE